MENLNYLLVGKKIDTVDVRISKRIIQLFSEGLYSSPHKAIEELVSNAYDAGAYNVHVILSADLSDQNATIVVIDDGEGMNPEDLKNHWIIGKSNRRNKQTNLGRKPIGKFGIGKLATYVLARNLTHICKKDNKYYVVTMDYDSALRSDSGKSDVKENQEGVFDEKNVSLPLREISEIEAKVVLNPWISGSKKGYQILKLFGKNASSSWTVAILSNLKMLGRSIQRGKLKWVLRTAMPLRDDFKLYFNGEVVESSKINVPLLEKWIIGKDIVEGTLKQPCPDDFTKTEDDTLPENSDKYYGLSHPILGRITGYIELYKDDISKGKSGAIGRSNGFFIYVRERLINTADDDDGFGIPRNLLRHGTFSQFRMVVNIDNLDKALRSSRESLQEGELYKLTQNFLHAAFNLVRNRLVDYEKTLLPGAMLSERILSTPGSLTRLPLLHLAREAIQNRINPIYLRLPLVTDESEKKEIIKLLDEKLISDESIVQTTDFQNLDSSNEIATYDVLNNKLIINLSHPFVASFQELYLNQKNGMPLEMYAMTEILTEAFLYQEGYGDRKIRRILSQRDELLRFLVRSAIKRTPNMISIALCDAKFDEKKLEEEMRASFEAIGFDNVIRRGGKGKPDGTAEAYLSASVDREVRYYRVGLEAKSGGKVSAKRLGVSGIARHMKEFKCDHHIVIGNGFETSTKEASASVKEIQELKASSKKTITLMLIDDLARLVRLVPAKRIGLDRLRELFQTCITPEESKKWINEVQHEKVEKPPYAEILTVIWNRAKKRPDEPVEYSAIMVKLEERKPPLDLKKDTIIRLCRAMQAMAPGIVFARDDSVEIKCRPDIVLEKIKESVDSYPEGERVFISL